MFDAILKAINSFFPERYGILSLHICAFIFEQPSYLIKTALGIAFISPLKLVC